MAANERRRQRERDALGDGKERCGDVGDAVDGDRYGDRGGRKNVALFVRLVEEVDDKTGGASLRDDRDLADRDAAR